MTDSEATPTPWHRLRNAAIQYVGVGWFLTQVAAVLGRQLGWPPQIGDFLVIVLGLGFLVTLGVTLIFARRPRVAGAPSGGLIVALLAAVAGLALWLTSGGQPEIKTGGAGLVRESRGLFSTATELDGYFVIQPQRPLVPTGIRVRSGQTISVWSEGHINIALARLVEAVDVGDAVAYEWVGPEGEVNASGEPVLRRDRARAGREQCLLNQAFPYGALLLAITPTDRLTPGAVRDLRAGREVFGTGEHVSVNVEVDGFVTLGVNDVYLDEEECDPEAFSAGTAANAFFRDNLGFFSVRVEVR